MDANARGTRRRPPRLSRGVWIACGALVAAWFAVVVGHDLFLRSGRVDMNKVARANELRKRAREVAARLEREAGTRGPMRMRFSSGTAQETISWQHALSARLRQVIPVRDDRTEPVSCRLVERIDLPGRSYTIERIVLARASRKRAIKGRIARPRRLDRPVPGVLAPPGHTGDSASVFNPDPKEIYRYGHVLASAGCVVLSIDVDCNGAQEGPVVAARIEDILTALDYLASLAEVDAKRIGVAGLSLGGQMATYGAAFD